MRWLTGHLCGNICCRESLVEAGTGLYAAETAAETPAVE